MNSRIAFSNFKSEEVFADSAYDYTKWREQFILTILQIASIVGVALIAVSFPTATTVARILFVGLYIVLFLITALPATYAIRSYTFLAILFIVGLNIVLSWGPWVDSSVFFLTFIVMASLLFDNRADIAAIVLSAVTYITIATLQQTGIYQINALNPATGESISAINWVVYSIDLLLPGIVLAAAINKLKQEFVKVIQKRQEIFEAVVKDRTTLEEKVSERTNELEIKTEQMHASAVVAREVAEIENVTDLMDTLPRLAAEQFGYYHIGLYLLDENKKTAFLQASSSAIGKELVGQGFHIEPDRRNPFYIVVDQKHFHIISDANSESFTADANFPRTRSRMTLPLTTRGKAIGILDVHSDQPNAFSSQNAEVMQILADLAAISIDNVRLLNETKSLANQLDASISFQARETWSKLTSRHTPAYQYTPAGVRPIFHPKTENSEDDLTMPLILHGQNIGAVKLRRKGIVTGWSERERVLIEKIAEQVALALENSRLVDEAQKNALRDKMIAAFSSHVRETLDIESVARTAAAELRKIFDLKEAEISIGATQIRSNVSTRSTGDV